MKNSFLLLLAKAHIISKRHLKVRVCIKPDPRQSVLHAMHHRRMDIPSCPFCPFSDTDLQFVAEHIDFCHPENGAPGAEHGGSTMEQQDTAPWGDEGNYLDCPHGCGEVIVDTELPTHMDLHFAEEVANDEAGSPQPEARSEGLDAYRLGEFPEDDNNLDAYEHLMKKGRSGPKGALRETSQKASIAHSPPPKTTVAGGVKRLGVSIKL